MYVHDVTIEGDYNYYFLEAWDIVKGEIKYPGYPQLIHSVWLFLEIILLL